MKYAAKARMIIPAVLGFALACDGVQRIQSPLLVRGALEKVNSVAFSNSEIKVRVRFDGEMLAPDGWSDRMMDPPPPSRYEIGGQAFVYDEVASLPAGTYTLRVLWHNEEVASENVTLGDGESLLREIDLGANAGRIAGRLIVNGEVAGNRNLCAGFGFMFSCEVTAPDGTFSLIVRAGAGELQVWNTRVRYDASASATTNLGDVKMETAAVRLSIIFQGREVEPELLANTCSFSLLKPGFSSGRPCNFTGDFDPGVYEIWQRLHGQNLDAPRPVTLVTGTTRLFSYDMTPKTGIVSGKLTFNGEVVGQQGWCVKSAAGTRLCDMTKDDGTFRAFLPAGATTLEIQRFKTIWSTEFIVPAGERADLGSVDVKVSGARVSYTYLGGPVAPDACSVMFIDSDLGGRFVPCDGTTEAMPAGAYRILARYAGELVADENVTVGEGATVARVYEIGTLVGRITGQAILNGRALPENRPICATPGGAFQFAVCGTAAADGRFSLIVPGGEGTLFISGVEAMQPYTAVVGQTIEVGEPEPGETPVGAGVEVSPIDATTGAPSPTSITFNSVTSAGETTVSSHTVGQQGGPPAPSSFKLGNPPTYYDISTTATFSGPVTVCIQYDPASFPKVSKVKLLHFENDAWVNITTTVDEQTNTVCGVATSLSPFLVGQEIYPFVGFFRPIENTDVNGNVVVNSARAGAAIPVKFSLGGDRGLNIIEAGYPQSRSVACDLSATSDLVEEAVNAGQSALSYDATVDQYTYIWKTAKTWTGCRQLIVRLDDGTEHIASFVFK